MTDLTIPTWFIWLVSVFGMGGIGWASWVSMTLVKIKTSAEFHERSVNTIIVDNTIRYDRLVSRIARHSEEIALIRQHIGMKQRRDPIRDTPNPSHSDN